MRPLLLTSLVLLMSGCPEKTGPAGADGMNGAMGAPGPKGDTGATGPAGPAGPQGPQGEPGQVLIVDGGVLVGPRGASVVVTPVAPGSACAAGGISVTAEDGGVTFVCNGVAGAQGPQGPSGPAGAPGAAGASVTLQSVDGGPCANGGALLRVDGGAPVYVCNGASGPQGPAGANGVNGVNGMNGAAGQNGAPGTPGSPGSPGATGPQGPVGPPGPPGSGAGGGNGSDPSGGFSFAGHTVSTYTGNLGGLPGANAKCNAEFSGSHICTYREYQWAGASTGIPVTGSWIELAQTPSPTTPFFEPRDRNNQSNCSNWQATTNTSAGFLDTTGFVTIDNSSCASAKPVACCRSRTAWFRGFTTATYTGNLNGPTGANAKCHAEFAGSHLCTWREYQWAGVATATPSGGAWVDQSVSAATASNSPRDRDSINGGCSNWLSAAANVNAYSLDAFGFLLSGTGPCATQKPLTCCGGN